MGAPIALVTGISGFTGHYVARALEDRGYAVHGWTHEDSPRPDRRRVELTDRAQVAEAISALAPSVVIHLAAISYVAHGDADTIYRVNVVGTRNLLEALAALPNAPGKVLLASSANVYGNGHGVLDETAPMSPQNDYAISKVAMEHVAKLWSDRLPITIVRPFNYTGVGHSEKFLIPKIVAHFRRRADAIELGNLDVSRDFYDVRCVAQAYVRLIESDVRDEVFNICSGTEYSLRQVIEMLETIANHKIDVRVNPDFVRPNEVKRLRGDPAKLIDRIGSLEDIALIDTLRWMYEYAG